MKRMLCVLAALMMAVPASAKEAEPSAEDEAFDNFLQSYHQAPDPSQAIARIPQVEKMARKSRSASGPLSGFYYGASRSSPERKEEWRAAADKTKARWLKKAIEQGLEGKKLEDVVSDDLEKMGPGTLDFMWGCFFATGDPAIPRLIIRRGAVKFPEDATLDLTQRVAQWSALAIAKTNPIVREELEEFAKTATDGEVCAFFGGVVPDHAKTYLSEESVKRAESLKPPKVEEAEAAEVSKEESVQSCIHTGYIAAKEGESTLVFEGMTIAELAKGEFSAKIGGAWINGGEPVAAKGYNKEYRTGERLRVQFQCVDKGDGKEYVKCVRVVFTDSPEGVRAVCDYTGFVTLGYKKNALGFDFKDDANWKAVSSADGKGYGIAEVRVEIPKSQAGGSQFIATDSGDAQFIATASPAFAKDYDAARERAKANGRNLFLLFTGSDWCVWCKRLEKEVVSKPEFLDWATNEYECVVLDFPHDETLLTEKERRRNGELQEKFGVEGFPSVLVVDANDESEKFRCGYERGGAKKWIATFKKEMRLEPLRKKYFGALNDEMVDLLVTNSKSLLEIGKPLGTNEAERVKALFAAWAVDMRGIGEKLEALDVPEELAEEKREMLESIEEHLGGIGEVLEMSAEEIVDKFAGDDDEDDDEDAAGAKAPFTLPVEGAGTAIDAMENSHVPFGERLFVAPEIAMLGDKAEGVDIAKIVREWLLNRPIRNINWTSTFAEYAADADKAWAAGARTPFVAIAHLARGNTGLDAKGIAAERRKVWEMWKDDPRWPLASRIAYIATWATWNKNLSNELDRISIDLKKKFIVSDEWKPEEIDRARWVLSLRRSNNKQLFDELKAEGVAFDPWLEASSLAQWHIDKAWDERGDGFASTVTDEGWAGYREHRVKAVEWAEKAYRLRPDLSAPCTVGLKANYGNRAEALKWYKRAAAIFKDDVHAASEFVWGFRPRWGGNTLAMMAFYKMFLSDDFADTIMPAWAIDNIYWAIFKEETYRGPERNYEEWAEDNADLIRRFSDLYMNGGYLRRKGVSLGTRNFVRRVFLMAAWSMGDMELFQAWREFDGAKAQEEKLTYAQAVKDTVTWRDNGIRALADWVATRPENERKDLLHALRHAFGRWEPMRKGCRDHTHDTRNYEPFATRILPLMYSGAISKDNTPDLPWGYLRSLAGSCIGTMALEPGGHDFTGMLPKNLWGDIYEGISEMVVEFDVSVPGPETKGEAMMHFDFGASRKDFYQRFSVLTVANKTDEKDNRFAILPWPKGVTKKSVKVVFRGRDVEVYDNGKLAYARQLRDGAQNVTKISFARSNTNTVPFDRIFIKATVRPPEE